MLADKRWTLILLLLTSGCGSGSKVALVEGTVTRDGKPLPDIRVLFQPENIERDSAGAGSFGLTDASGKFVLKFSDTLKDGAVVGKHTVVLSDKLTEDPADSDAGFAAKVPKSRIPPKYAKSPIVFEVQPGIVNQADLALSTK